MSPQTKTAQQWALGSTELREAFTDFVLSRQGMLCSENTIKFYSLTCGSFIQYLEAQSISSAGETTVRHVREFLALLAGSGKSDRTVFDYAGGIRTMVRFWFQEGYLSSPITFQLPRFAKKRLPTLDAAQLSKVIQSCDNPRDRCLIMLMADSGLRRGEVLALNWGDLDFQTGVLRVAKAKMGKFRSSIVGATARRQLLKYRRGIEMHGDDDPLFQTRNGTRFTEKGFAQIFAKLSKKSGIHCTPHGMRRCFTILSLRSGMSPMIVQRLGGWESMELLKMYAQLEDIDLINEHAKFSPIDRLRSKG